MSVGAGHGGRDVSHLDVVQASPRPNAMRQFVVGLTRYSEDDGGSVDHAVALHGDVLVGVVEVVDEFVMDSFDDVGELRGDSPGLEVSVLLEKCLGINVDLWRRSVDAIDFVHVLVPCSGYGLGEEGVNGREIDEDTARLFLLFGETNSARYSSTFLVVATYLCAFVVRDRNLGDVYPFAIAGGRIIGGI
jgi:hypothetical protein